MIIEKNANLQQIEVFGDDYARRTMFQPREVVINYNQNHIQIAKKKRGGIFYLDLSESCRALIIGINGAGKTWLFRGTFNRLKLTGRVSILIPTDIKDEFYSNKHPLQRKFHNLLLPGEKPSGEKILVLRPTFFKQKEDKLNTETNNVWYSPDLRKMSKDDFLTFFNFAALKELQQAVVERLFVLFTQAIKTDYKTFDFRILERWINEMGDVAEPTKKSLKLRFGAVYNSHFYEPKHMIDIVQKIKEGYTISINLEKYDEFMQGSFLYVHTIIAMVVRECINARRDGKQIKRLFIGLEEAARFIAEDSTSSVKQVAMESYERDRRYGVDWWAITQSLSSMPKRIVESSRYVFVPSSVAFDIFKDCYVNFGMANSVQNAGTEAMRLYKQMTPGKREWMVFDRTERSATIIIPLAPLSEHAESTI